jgi:diacylglycerol kinase (ATP)
MPTPRQVVIANRNAGSADGLEAALTALGPHELWLTDAPEDATNFARRAQQQGFERVIAAGGDGTINEVLNGLCDDFGQQQFGVLPLGTANDLARTLNVPPQPETAAAILHEGRVRQFDVVRLEPEGAAARYFLNVSAGGFSTKLADNLDETTKLWWGSLAYGVSALKTLSQLEPYALRLEIDDEPPLELSAYNLAVANARFVGGGVPVAPRAQPDDGLLDLVVFKEVPMARLLTLVPKALLGEHLDDEDVLFRQVRSLEIEARPALQLNTDGEIVGCCPARFSVLPRALAVVVGPQ